MISDLKSFAVTALSCDIKASGALYLILDIDSWFEPPAAGDTVVVDDISTTFTPVSEYVNTFAKFVVGPTTLKNSISILPAASGCLPIVPFPNSSWYLPSVF